MKQAMKFGQTKANLAMQAARTWQNGGKCTNWVNSSDVLKKCPIACLLCDPDGKRKVTGEACYDSVITGVRFKNGPQATCKDLSAYCNHATLHYHVQGACKKTCGKCDAHVGHVEGECKDLQPHEEPEFRVTGKIASCQDLMDFCGGATGTGQSYLVRHKCPETCGACPQSTTTTLRFQFPTSNEASFNSGEDSGNCDRRRRWGFCSSRRRRNM